MSVKEKAEQFGLSSLNGWELAEFFGCGYTGDCDPINHGGTFYDNRDWKEHGYASCVSFSQIDGKLLVESGTIHKPSNEDDIASAHECCDTPDELRDDVGAQIEACLFYWGCETSCDFGGPYSRWFEERCDYNEDDDDDWDWIELMSFVRQDEDKYGEKFTEEQLLESVSGWLRFLGE